MVYTVNLGNYDTIKKIPKQKGFDYFLFTDENKVDFNDTNWTIISIPKIVENLNISIIKKQRFIKTHPHLFFSNYDISIYIDGIYTIKGDLNEFLLRILTNSLSIYALEHPWRNSIRQEFLAVKKFKKENKSNIFKLRNRYNKSNFPDKNGLIESCIIIRKHNDINCINIMDEWFDNIEKYSHRDQLSFNYIIWKKKKKIKYFSKSLFFQYFSKVGVHQKRLIFKR